MTGRGRNVDFDLHGFVRVRAVDADQRDVRMLRRQLGLDCSDSSGEPDLTVRFVDSFAPNPLSYAGVGEAGSDGENFYLLRGKQGLRARTRLAFDRIGAPGFHVVCERGVGAVPHLLSLVNLAALAKGVLPLHASAFVLDGRGVLATGWSKGGKTETLLAFAQHGARYVGDEWVYLTAEGEMRGLPEPIRLWYWHLRQLPGTWRTLPLVTRARLTALDTAAGMAERAAQRSPAAPASVLRRGAPVLGRQAYRQIPPSELFGPDGTVSGARLEALLLVTVHDRPGVEVHPVDGGVVADRMRASLAEERSAFLAHYRQFRYLFPDRCSEVLDRAEEIEAKLLTALFAGRPAYEVRHPYPFRLADLVDPVRAALDHLTDIASNAPGETS